MTYNRRINESRIVLFDREKVFENFVTVLPSLLLRPSIDDVVIRMIGQIVLRFKKSGIHEELLAKHESIIGKKLHELRKNHIYYIMRAVAFIVLTLYSFQKVLKKSTL